MRSYAGERRGTKPTGYSRARSRLSPVSSARAFSIASPRVCSPISAAREMETVVLDGRTLDPDKLERIARGASVAVDPASQADMRRGREIVERYLRERIPAYGLNTGLGLRSDEVLRESEVGDFSARMVRGRAQGLGPPLSPEEARAVMATRLNTLLSGEAGASVTVADHLVEAINRGFVPVIPRWASIGAG